MNEQLMEQYIDKYNRTLQNIQKLHSLQDSHKQIFNQYTNYIENRNNYIEKQLNHIKQIYQPLKLQSYPQVSQLNHQTNLYVQTLKSQKFHLLQQIKHLNKKIRLQQQEIAQKDKTISRLMVFDMKQNNFKDTSKQKSILDCDESSYVKIHSPQISEQFIEAPRKSTKQNISKYNPINQVFNVANIIQSETQTKYKNTDNKRKQLKKKIKNKQEYNQYIEFFQNMSHQNSASNLQNHQRILSNDLLANTNKYQEKSIKEPDNIKTNDSQFAMKKQGNKSRRRGLANPNLFKK